MKGLRKGCYHDALTRELEHHYSLRLWSVVSRDPTLRFASDQAPATAAFLSLTPRQNNKDERLRIGFCELGFGECSQSTRETTQEDILDERALHALFHSLPA